MGYNIGKTLESIFAKDIACGYKGWGQSKLCPYKNSQLEYFIDQTKDQLKGEQSRYDAFLKHYHGLDFPTKKRLKEWAKSEFTEKTWSAGIGPRPDWTWKHVLSKINDSKTRKSFLDIGSCHGLHGILHFKEFRNANFDFYSCELLPAYLKLHTVFGVDARMWHSKHSSLKNLFEGETFDIVACTEVIEHLTDEDEKNLLQDFKYIVRPGGTVYITYPIDAAVKKTNLKEDPLGHRHQPILKDVISRLGDEFEIKNQDSRIKSGRHEQQAIIAIKK